MMIITLCRVGGAVLLLLLGVGLVAVVLGVELGAHVL
jgi:hypothetical protein